MTTIRRPAAKGVWALDTHILTLVMVATKLKKENTIVTIATQKRR